MRNIFLPLLVLTIFTACEKGELPSEGQFTGTFQRSHGPVAEVDLNINGNRWRGVSNMRNYPALCMGTFNVAGDTVSFVNECFFTADFDHSLILDGKYQLTRHTETALEFHRTYPDGRMDTYKLRLK